MRHDDIMPLLIIADAAMMPRLRDARDARYDAIRCYDYRVTRICAYLC